MLYDLHTYSCKLAELQMQTTRQDRLFYVNNNTKNYSKILKTHKDSSTTHSEQHQSKVRKQKNVENNDAAHFTFLLYTSTKIVIFSCPGVLTF